MAAVRYLSRWQVGPGKMHKDENLLLVANDAGLADGEDVGRHGGNGEAERDVPLEVVLDDQLRLHLELHELDDVLERVGRTVEEAGEAADGVGTVRRRGHLCTNVCIGIACVFLASRTSMYIFCVCVNPDWKL